MQLAVGSNGCTRGPLADLAQLRPGAMRFELKSFCFRERPRGGRHVREVRVGGVRSNTVHAWDRVYRVAHFQ